MISTFLFCLAACSPSLVANAMFITGTEGLFPPDMNLTSDSSVTSSVNLTALANLGAGVKVNLTQPLFDPESPEPNATDIKTAKLPNFDITKNRNFSTSKTGRTGLIAPSTEKRDDTPATDSDPNTFLLRWSRDHMDSDNGTLYALPVPTASLRDALNHVIVAAGLLTTEAVQEHFQVDYHNVSIIMSSLSTSPANETANWWDLQNICQIFLADIDDGANATTDSFAGVVFDAMSQPIWEIVVLPTFEYAQDIVRFAVPSDFNATASTNVNPSGESSFPAPSSSVAFPSSLIPQPSARSLPRALSKRDDPPDNLVQSIPRTQLTTLSRLGPSQAPGYVLLDTIKYALSAIKAARRPDAGYKAFTFSPALATYGDHAFRLWTLGPTRFTKPQMRSILTYILALTKAYVSSKQAKENASYRTIAGRIVDESGKLVAQYLLGEPATGLSGCERYRILQLDGEYAVGCLLA